MLWFGVQKPLKKKKKKLLWFLHDNYKQLRAINKNWHYKTNFLYRKSWFYLKTWFHLADPKIVEDGLGTLGKKTSFRKICSNRFMWKKKKKCQESWFWTIHLSGFLFSWTINWSNLSDIFKPLVYLLSWEVGFFSPTINSCWLTHKFYETRNLFTVIVYFSRPPTP